MTLQIDLRQLKNTQKLSLTIKILVAYKINFFNCVLTHRVQVFIKLFGHCIITVTKAFSSQIFWEDMIVSFSRCTLVYWDCF